MEMESAEEYQPEVFQLTLSHTTNLSQRSGTSLSPVSIPALGLLLHEAKRLM